MAHFRGTITSTGAERAKLGTKASGLNTTANGWAGGVTVRLNVRGGVDYAYIALTNGSGAGLGHVPPVVLYDGPIDETHRAFLNDQKDVHAFLASRYNSDE